MAGGAGACGGGERGNLSKSSAVEGSPACGGLACGGGEGGGTGGEVTGEGSMACGTLACGGEGGDNTSGGTTGEDSGVCGAGTSGDEGAWAARRSSKAATVKAEWAKLLGRGGRGVKRIEPDGRDEKVSSKRRVVRVVMGTGTYGGAGQ